MCKQLLLCLLFIAAFTGLMRAEEHRSADKDSLGTKAYLLPTVRVIAESPVEALSTVKRVIPPANMKLSAYEALQGIGGLSNTNGTKDESNLRIRGFRRSEVKIFVDGRPLNSGYFGNIDLSNLPMDDIAEIQIISGPSSALYGNNSMGGVVNMVTMDAREGLRIKLQSVFRRNNTQRFLASLSQREDGFGYRITASHDRSDGFMLSRGFESSPFESGGVRDNSHKKQWNVQASADISPTPYQRLAFSAGLSYTDEKPVPSSVYELDFRRYLDWAKYQSSLMWEGILSESTGLSAILYFDGGQDRYQQFNDPAMQFISIDSRMRGHSIGFAPRVQLRGWQNATLDAGMMLETRHNTRKDNGSYPEWTPHYLNNYNAYLQGRYTLTDIIGISSGQSLSMYHTDLSDTLRAFWEPSLALQALYPNGSGTNLSIGRSTSFPTMRQIFAVERGNPWLRPQTAWKTELSHNIPFRLGVLSCTATATAFYNDVRDLIAIYNGIYDNVYRVRSYGSEAELQIAYGSVWQTQVDYAWLDYSRDSDYRLTESPRHSWNIYHRLMPAAGWVLTLRSSYIGDRQSQDGLNIYHTLPAYWKHDISVSTKWRIWNVGLGVDNFTDANYETEYGYPAAGLNFNLSLGVEF